MVRAFENAEIFSHRAGKSLKAAEPNLGNAGDDCELLSGHVAEAGGFDDRYLLILMNY